jgi:hypothetical protein
MAKQGQHECTKCEAGQTTTTASSLVCKKCRAGKYAHRTGQPSCVDCEMGRVSPPKPEEFEFKFDKLKKRWLTDPQEKKTKHDAQVLSGKIVEEFGLVWKVEMDRNTGNNEQLNTLKNEIKRSKRNRTGLYGNVLVNVVYIEGRANVAPALPATCLLCKAGTWTNQTRGEFYCKLCPPGKKGVRKIDAKHSLNTQHQTYGTCETCSQNTYSNISGSDQCFSCPTKTWTSSKSGQQECVRCVQGQIWTPQKNCLTCPAIDPTSIADRGQYSFVRAGQRCHDCPPGHFCHGGSKMSMEWGWWESSGLTLDKEKVVASLKRSNAIPLNAKKCSSYYDESKNKNPNAKEIVPFECGDLCERTTDPGCTCKYNTDGVEECRFFCDGGDDLEFGLYMDACGLPKMVTRCPGFQKLISCEDEFRDQMKELEDGLRKGLRKEIKIPAHCNACRANQIAQAIHISTHVVMKSPNKISINKHVAMTQKNSIPVDILWLFDSGLEDHAYSLHRGRPKNPQTEPWDLVQVTYQMPGAGVWDTDPYKQHRDLGRSLKERGELKNITVCILKNDPRVSFILKNIQDQLSATNKSADEFHNSDSNNDNVLLHSMQCNVMAGYSGRLCRTCLPGFSRVGNKCVRCPPYSVCVQVLLLGIFVGFALTMMMVLAVVADAGSTSTASSLKRIVLNHMQTIAMLLHFDLDWPPETTSFFSLLGAVSSIGDDLIQTSCILGVMSPNGLRPFYVTQIGFILLPGVLLLPGTIFLALKYGCCCIKKKIIPHNTRASQQRIADLKRIREQQAHSSTSAEEEAELRANYNHVLDELRTSGIEDAETASKLLADSSAIARLRARDFMEHVRRNRIDLKEWFQNFDENNLGSIKITDFILIVKSMGLEWTEDDYVCVAGLFGNRSARDKCKENGRVSLAKIMSYEKNYGDRWIVMLLTICYVLYPTISRKIFTTLSCRSGLMEGDSTSYLWDDLEISCDSAGHVSFIIFVGTPGVLFYILGFPVISLYSLGRRLKKYGWTNDTTMFRYAVIVSGYTHKRWYWEIVICARKVLLTMTAVFLKNYGPERQFIFANLVLMVAMMLQVRERPFSNDELNTLENWSLGILFVTLYLGLFFFWDLVEGSSRTLLGIFIIALNVLYMLWLCGSLVREYLARHQSRWTQLISQKVQTDNPIMLCVLAFPCLLVLIFMLLFDAFKFVCSCGGRVGPWARRKQKEIPLSQVVPANLMKRQRMKLKEAIHIHMEHAKVRLRAIKAMKVSKQTRDLHRMKLVRGHSKSATRLEKRLAARNKSSANLFRQTQEETRRKLFDQTLVEKSETMDRAGLLDKNPISRVKSRTSMSKMVHKAKNHNDAHKLIGSHEESVTKKKDKHKVMSIRASSRLKRRLSNKRKNVQMRVAARTNK